MSAPQGRTPSAHDMDAATMARFERETIERELARRLFETWRTAGNLGGRKWEWASQTDQQKAAWVAVLRAAMVHARGMFDPEIDQAPIEIVWGPHEIAQVLHG